MDIVNNVFTVFFGGIILNQISLLVYSLIEWFYVNTKIHFLPFLVFAVVCFFIWYFRHFECTWNTTSWIVEINDIPFYLLHENTTEYLRISIYTIRNKWLTFIVFSVDIFSFHIICFNPPIQENIKFHHFKRVVCSCLFKVVFSQQFTC